jgi:hypothetical protein
MRHLFNFLILLTFLTLSRAWAADPPGDEQPKLIWPKEVQTVLDNLQIAEERALREYKAKLAALRAPALKEIQAVKDRVTKSGNLEGALALRNLGAKVGAGEYFPPPVERDILGMPIRESAPVGKWHVQNGWEAKVIIQDDGSIIGITDKKVTGKYKQTEKGISITWWNGVVYDLQYIDNSRNKMASDKNGSMPKMTRIE